MPAAAAAAIEVMCTAAMNSCRAFLLCRKYAEQHHINEELRKLLPHGEGKPTEEAAERALQERM